MARLNIGLRQAKLLCQMSADERLDLIASGLPIILESAQGFWCASAELDDRPREADVLEGFAEEEAAKILILMDAIRCPLRLMPTRLSTIVGHFYDHHARLIYAESQAWKPMHMAELRGYVDRRRDAHYLEGNAGEYIVPNWNIARREGLLYADIEAYEDRVPRWNKPKGRLSRFSRSKPIVLQVAEALSAVGVFCRRGLDATANIWGQVEFKDAETHTDAERLTRQLLERLIAEGLPAESATQRDVSVLYESWQLPMYGLELRLVDVPIGQLEKERDEIRRTEAGYYFPDGY